MIALYVRSRLAGRTVAVIAAIAVTTWLWLWLLCAGDEAITARLLPLAMPLAVAAIVGIGAAKGPRHRLHQVADHIVRAEVHLLEDDGGRRHAELQVTRQGLRQIDRDGYVDVEVGADPVAWGAAGDLEMVSRLAGTKLQGSQLSRSSFVSQALPPEAGPQQKHARLMITCLALLWRDL
jgi:hypothetical protein